MGMLHRPEAAYLTQIGRMYLQVGTDEIFEEVQCAYTGAEYEPEEGDEHKEVQVCDLVFLDGATISPKAKKIKKKESISQLNCSISYIISECKKHKVRGVDKLWLPLLPKILDIADLFKSIDVNQLQEDGSLCAIYGLVDDVIRQQQNVLSVDLLNMSNLLIAGQAGCGKTTLLQTMLYSITKLYNADDVNYYIYAYSGVALHTFAASPQCGGVVPDPYTATEKAERLMELIRKIMAERRNLFSEMGVSNLKEYRKKQKLPVILLIIDNYALWSQAHQQGADFVQQIMRDGPKYGIQIIATISSYNEIKLAAKSYIQQTIMLQLAEKSSYREYSTITPSAMPVATKGRGLTLLGGDLLEYQTAMATDSLDESVRNEFVKEEVQEHSKRMLLESNTKAKPIPVLPRDKTYSELCSLLGIDVQDKQTILVGYNVHTMEPFTVDFAKVYTHIISDFLPEHAGTYHMLAHYVKLCSKKGWMQRVISLNGLGGGVTEEVGAVTFSAVKDYQTKLSTLYGQGNPEDVEKALSYLNKLSKQGQVAVYETLEDMYFSVCDLNMLFALRMAEKESFLKSGGTSEQYIKQTTPIVYYIPDMKSYYDILKAPEMQKLIADKNNGAKMDFTKMLENMFKRGNGYGVHFVVGFTKEAHTECVVNPFFKQIATNKSVVHFGGHLDNQRLFESSQSMSAQAKATASVNEAVTSVSGSDVMLWIP